MMLHRVGSAVVIACLFHGVAGAQTVDRFGLFEASFQHTGSYANPYLGVASAVATLTAPDGTTRQAPLFWDGGNTWRLRFSPDQVGQWTYSVSSTDAGLNGAAGSFGVAASSLPGGIVANASNPHTFQTQSGDPFYFMGDTAWSAFVNSSAEQHNRAAFEHYVDARAAQGFNVVHAIGWNNDGGAPFNSFAGQTINPAYFREIDERVAYLNSRGITAGMLVAWGWDSGYSYSSLPDNAARQRYAAYVAARYGAYNTYFIVAGEWDEVLSESQVNQFGQAIADADPHDRLVAVHAAASSTRQFADESWAGFGDYQQNYDTLHAQILASRNLGKPVVNAEYAYFLRDQDGNGAVDKPNSASIDDIRHATWDIATAGGHFITGFGTTYFGGHRDPGPFNVDAAQNDPWEAQVQHVKTFFTDRAWWRFNPRDDLVTSDTARTGDATNAGVRRPPLTTYWAMSDEAGEYIVYLRGLTDEVELTLLEDGENLYHLTRFDPRLGTYLDLGQVVADGVLTITPADTNDWVYAVSLVPEPAAGALAGVLFGLARLRPRRR